MEAMPVSPAHPGRWITSLSPIWVKKKKKAVLYLKQNKTQPNETKI